MCLLIVNRESAQEKIALAPALRRRKKGGMDGKIGKFGKQIEDGKHSKQREDPFPFIMFFFHSGITGESSSHHSLLQPRFGFMLKFKITSISAIF